MRKQAFSWIVIVSFGLISFTLFALAAAGNLTAAPAGLPTAVTDGLYANHRSDGVINVATLGIFGPKICTVYGDPYSPLNSDWAPGPYTYTYRIRIPADYSSDIIRVELFDPDSINNALTAATVTHTQIAV
ncbi:MAG: hypothetical protein GY803_07270, partial [Chloroflexi bacterium]|nr:hypothetical protein [Chloroflexota bacterium]